jgi:hypothetical protein
VTDPPFQVSTGGQAGSGGSAASSGDADGSSGAATDAIAAFGSALVKAAETKPTSTADPTVSAAFALGWHMYVLYDKHSPGKDREPADLPGLSRLGEQQQLAVVINQVETGVNKLNQPVTKAGLDPIDLTDLKGLIQKQTNDDPVLAVQEQLLIELVAVDQRLGKAYELGRALAWLDDLASALPPHAAHSVATSLGRWSDALYPPNDGRLAHTFNPRKKLQSWRDRRRRPRTINATDPYQAKEAVKTLRRQGQLWRALLSGEKQGKDMLEIENYLDAGKELVHRTAVITRRAVLKMPLLTLAILGLVGAGIWLLSQGTSSQSVAGATSVLTAVGLTWKGLGGTLGQLAGKLGQPLWGAVLDDAIADAITLLPGNKAEKAGRRQVALAVTAARQAERSDRVASA